MSEFEDDALPCCNVIEPDGQRCPGMARFGFPTYICDTCGTRCGTFAHPDCAARADQ